jgi:anti-sigma-K factor RskA
VRDLHVTDLIDGFLLGALESEEEERVRAHILDCEACAQLLADSRLAIDALAESVGETGTAPSSRDRLLAAAQRRTAVTGRRTMVPAWTLAVAATIGVAMIAGMAAWIAVLYGRLDDRGDDLAAARQAAASFAISSEMLHMESDYAGHAIDAAISVPREGQEVTIVVNGLPPSEEGHGYRLWLLAKGGDPVSLTLSPDADGNVVVRTTLDLEQFDEMELDAQPLEATAPGGQLVIGGPLR